MIYQLQLTIIILDFLDLHVFVPSFAAFSFLLEKVQTLL